MLNELLKIFKKPKKDYSKSDKILLNSLDELVKRQRQNELLFITPADQSNYESRRAVSSKNPDYVGPMGYAGIGTKDRMPGTRPTQSLSNKINELLIKPKREKYPGFL
jgi:hypothetical protein